MKSLTGEAQSNCPNSMCTHGVTQSTTIPTTQAGLSSLYHLISFSFFPRGLLSPFLKGRWSLYEELRKQCRVVLKTLRTKWTTSTWNLFWSGFSLKKLKWKDLMYMIRCVEDFQKVESFFEKIWFITF